MYMRINNNSVLSIYTFAFKVTDNGVSVIQLETAAGAAIRNFNNACGIQNK